MDEDTIFNQLVDDLKDLFTEETKDYVKKLDKDFVKKLATQIAKQTLRLRKGGSEARHAEENIEHLKAQLKSEINISKMELYSQSSEFFEKALKIIITTVVKVIKNQLPI